MRYLRLLALALLLSGGCASQPADSQGYNTATVSTALVFDPPIARSEPRVDIPRDNREPQAFVGYASPVDTYYSIRVDDYQRSIGGYNFDRYDRQTYVQRFGATSR